MDLVSLPECCYHFRDNFFNTAERRRTRQQSKKGDIAGPDAPSRGVPGLRILNYKVDESRVLPMARLGIHVHVPLVDM